MGEGDANAWLKILTKTPSNKTVQRDFIRKWGCGPVKSVKYIYNLTGP